MISKYFKPTGNLLDQIPPAFDVEALQHRDNSFWNLKKHYYESIAWADAFDYSELDRIIQVGNLFTEVQGMVGGAAAGIANPNVRMCKLAWMSINPMTQWIYQRLTDAINKINEEYFKYDLTMIETLQFTKYKEEEKGFYEKHIDPMGGWYEPHNRKLSFVLQLSDPNDYEGGDLLLYHGKEPMVATKERGKIIFFPSHTLHEVTPVTKGIRYSLVGWIHGPALK